MDHNHLDTRGDTSRHVHPRRPPADRSLSLLHSAQNAQAAAPLAQSDSMQKRVQEPQSTRAHLPSTSASRPTYQKDSSGESSNVEGWFESRNNNDRTTSPNYMLDEAPFLLRNSSSEESPNGLPSNPVHVPYRTSVLPLPTVASSSEDFRSVIDDLTIQNKKLKRRLRKYEKTQDAHLQQEKLFEVRMHGLPAEKKKELEEMLRKFVMDCSSSQPNPSSGRPQTTLGNARGKSSSHASTRFGDSTYASMSGTNQAPSATSKQHLRTNSQYGISTSGLSSAASLQKPRAPLLVSQPSGISSNNSLSTATAAYPGRGMSLQQNQTIHEYLHDIPLGLLPMNGSVLMSEKAKRKLVVRRLESIFAGKAPTSVGHQQALQQQEVSHSAVRADRQAMEDSGQQMPDEGAREAQFMLKARDNQLEHHDSTKNPLLASMAGETVDITIDERDFAKEQQSPEQRPTRPLDLDPYRVQVPEDNIQYIRHLGFSPSDYAAPSPPRQGRGWIYINLLINMAQLHTLNVTPDFVRKAVGEISNYLEVSDDGRKLRWKGGVDLTRTSSDGSPDSGHGQLHGMARTTATSRKDQRPGSRLAHSASNDGSSEMAKTVKARSKDRLTYTPLFFHKPDSDDEDEADVSEGEEILGWSSARKNIAGDSSGLMSSGMRTRPSRKKPAEDGPITFFNKANFCTDLSGDPHGKAPLVSNRVNYSRVQTAPLGLTGADAIGRLATVADVRGPLSDPRALINEDAMDTDPESKMHDVDLKLIGASDDSASDARSVATSVSVEFEASGIGGVEPKDHFAVHVRAKQLAAPVHSSHSSVLMKIPPRLRTGLSEDDIIRPVSGASKDRVRIQQQTISVQCKSLPPSELPPPSFYPLTSPEDNSDDDDSASEAEDVMSDVQLDIGELLPSAAPQLMAMSSLDSNQSYNRSTSEDDTFVEQDADDDRTDGIDLLAHARLIDPVAVSAREREYDCNLAERLAEEIPAGSSAATAGGGSGFNSPADIKDGEAKATARAPRGIALAPSLKRARTSEGSNIAANAGSRRRKSSKRGDGDSVSS